MRFDSQSDVASIVYGIGDNPDRLLMDFAADLRREGFRPAGFAQLGRNCRSESPGFGLVNLPSGEFVGLAMDSRRSGCRLDAGRLTALAEQSAFASKTGADLIIVNRFGRSEINGGGLLSLIERALDADVPLLIAISERRFPDWIRFCGGMNVRLNCDRGALDRWWQSVATPATLRQQCAAPSTFCELVK